MGQEEGLLEFGVGSPRSQPGFFLFYAAKSMLPPYRPCYSTAQMEDSKKRGRANMGSFVATQQHR